MNPDSETSDGRLPDALLSWMRCHEAALERERDRARDDRSRADQERQAQDRELRAMRVRLGWLDARLAKLEGTVLGFSYEMPADTDRGADLLGARDILPKADP